MPSRLEDCTSGVAGPLYKYSCQYSDDTRLGSRLAHLPRPQAVPVGPWPLSAAQGSGNTCPTQGRSEDVGATPASALHPSGSARFHVWGLFAGGCFLSGAWASSAHFLKGWRPNCLQGQTFRSSVADCHTLVFPASS